MKKIRSINPLLATTEEFKEKKDLLMTVPPGIAFIEPNPAGILSNKKAARNFWYGVLLIVLVAGATVAYCLFHAKYMR